MKKVIALFIILFAFIIFAGLSPGLPVSAAEVTTTQTQEEATTSTVTTTVAPTTTTTISIPAEITDNPLFQDLVNNETVQKLATLLGINVGILALILFVAFLIVKWLKKNWQVRITTSQAVAKRLDDTNSQTIGLQKQIEHNETNQASLVRLIAEQKAAFDIILQSLLILINSSKNEAVTPFKTQIQSAVSSLLAADSLNFVELVRIGNQINKNAMNLANSELPLVKTAAQEIKDLTTAVKESMGIGG